MGKVRKRTRGNGEVQKIAIISRVVEKVLSSLIKWASLAVIAYWAFRAIDTLAGQTTIADVRALVSWPDDDSWWVVVGALIFGVGGIAYGVYQRRIREDAIERMHDFQLKYERSIDPQRSSSRLTERGRTRPEDQ